MKQRKKLKRWQKGLIIALIALAGCVVLFPFVIFGMFILAELEVHPFGCHHRVNPVVSAELVSQEAPLVFYQLMEEPTIEGIKVKLTYEDGTSEVVDAYQSKWHYRAGVGKIHETGMFFHKIDMYQPFQRPALEPGVHLVPMYCVDIAYDRKSNPHYDQYGEPYDLTHCMVEVYAQTGDEYLAQHGVPNTTVTPSEDGTLDLNGDDRRGLVRFLAEESGTYLFTFDGDCFYFTHEYTGSGAVFEGSLGFRKEGGYVRLNANEPVFVPFYRRWFADNVSLRISLTRIPDDKAAKITLRLGE